MGNKRPVVLLTNREGAPFAIDPFAPELPNWNGLIFGGSGSGKSYSISQMMLQFCGQKTAFGRMLDGPSNVKLTKDLVSIEVKGLENYRDLKDIFLLLLTSYIKDEAASDLARPYLLIVDEAQRLFKSGSPMGREFAIDSFRVFRKYNAGIWCISQNYKDFLSDPDLADSLMPNTTFVFILRQRKIDWNDFKETFDFDDAVVEAAKSLEIVKRKFSEFLLIQDENIAVLRLESDPLSYRICTTDGNEKSEESALREKYPDRPLVEILNELAQGNT